MPPTRPPDLEACPVPTLRLPVRRRWLALPLAAGLLLAVVSAVLQVAKDRGFEPPSLQLDRLLNVDEDLSVLNWLTASTFLLAAVVAAAAAAGAAGRRQTWLAAAAVLAFVSLDEAAGLHDPVSASAEEQLRASGLRAAAVVVAALVVAGLVGWYLLRLAPPVRWRLAAAVGLVVLAAVAVDAAGPDLVNDPVARLRPGYVAKASIEEVLELGAAVLALDGMLVAALTR